MGINYDKWDNLEEYSSSDEDDRESVAAALRFKTLATDETKPKGLLITVPWDTYCEAVRWALDRHGVTYIEDNYPWGGHIWATFGFSQPMPKDQQVNVPIFRSGKGEIFRRSPVDIFTWLFAHSLSTTLRLYTPPDALDFQTMYDTLLAPAARHIFLHVVLNDHRLARKYLIETVHLKPWRAAYAVAWPIIRLVMKSWFGIGSHRALLNALNEVSQVFSKVEQVLEKQSASVPRGKEPYICGPKLTAADISFASHCIPILFPNPQKDSYATRLGMSVPSLSELPKSLAEKVKELRETRAGRHAIRMWRKERGDSLRTWRTRYGKENNPWWADEARLSSIIWGIITIAIGLMVALVKAYGFWFATLVLMGVTAVAACALTIMMKGTVWETRVKQMWFVCFSNHNISEPADKGSARTPNKTLREVKAWTPSREREQKKERAM
ncbi:uncharacterized protein SPPG_04142 [Spizellomyces punctatus DAOM BR117]|uniref:GST C-terminal domain-containing protein n=1 Tax=Spizellomyces punctatus (strain DAOM BR117) TaxID=645134 RepID=A0A0L0HJP0_SPIPD|nr:uncharacterized protein SPPG_04142 [Spizellomyces punctatus DAOM BR117]KND01049.1 hypothetical protein SPPG_04142 [Spizellomyces punctatus DAOM BR117]|eukprot:XP_016609088.1 hypothetical protein SPPG_04142 [Spizellomyces punctatus DAOM BR117]